MVKQGLLCKVQCAVFFIGAVLMGLIMQTLKIQDWTEFSYNIPMLSDYNSLHAIVTITAYNAL